jgi:class 3 adenylate cyclase
VTLALAVLAGAEFVALVVLAVLLLRSQRSIRDLRSRLAHVARAAPRTAAGRAMKAVVDTAARVREHGVGGLLLSSLDDLTRWFTEDRAEIARVAAPDGTVTIFFSDIEESTAHNERLGDDAWVRVLDAHDERLRRVIARHAGHVVKSQGDGFMVVFGEPAAAASAALDVQDAFVRSVPRTLRRTPIKVRIGMHLGTAVARDGDYFGRNVALAARIAAEALGGQVLVSDDFFNALEEDAGFDFAPCGAVELKGLAEPQTLWELKTA